MQVVDGLGGIDIEGEKVADNHYPNIRGSHALSDGGEGGGKL